MLEKLVNNVLQLDSNSLTKARSGNIIPYRGDLNQTLYEQTPIYGMTHKYKITNRPSNQTEFFNF